MKIRLGCLNSTIDGCDLPTKEDGSLLNATVPIIVKSDDLVDLLVYMQIPHSHIK